MFVLKIQLQEMVFLSSWMSFTFSAIWAVYENLVNSPSVPMKISMVRDCT